MATKKRDTEEALSLAQEELKLRQDIYTQDALCWALYRAGKWPEARAASDKAMALKTKDARILYHAGAIRMAMGEAKEGKKLIQKALALNPQFDFTGAKEAKDLLSQSAKAGPP